MSKSLPKNVFVEGFPRGAIAIARQGDQYRIIVSRPPNSTDVVLARAELALNEILEDYLIDESCKQELLDFDDSDDDDE